MFLGLHIASLILRIVKHCKGDVHEMALWKGNLKFYIYHRRNQVSFGHGLQSRSTYDYLVFCKKVVPRLNEHGDVTETQN